MRLWMFAPLFMAMVLAACGGHDSGARLPEGLDEALRTTTAFQRELLQDGSLTYQEYESSVFATVQCLREKNVKISVEPQRAPGQRLEFAYESTEENDTAVAEAYADCYQQFQNLVDILWFQQTQPSEEQLARARVALGACVREAGVPLPEPATAADFRSLAMAGNPALFACQEQISTEFDLPRSFIG